MISLKASICGCEGKRHKSRNHRRPNFFKKKEMRRLSFLVYQMKHQAPEKETDKTGSFTVSGR